MKGGHGLLSLMSLHPLMSLLGAAVLLQAPTFSPLQPDTFALGGSFTNAWADIDHDHDPDLFVGFGGTPNRLYRNDGGKFTDVAAEFGVADARPVRAAAWGDYDGDGDPDLLVGFTPGDTSLLKLYRNDGARFVDVTSGSGLDTGKGAVRQLSWIDIDGDRDHDLFVAFRDLPNRLYRNTANRFEDVAPELGLADPRRSVGAVWFDMDDDDDLDLVVANMDGDANALYRNDGGKFTDVADAAGIAWGGRTPKEPTNGTVRPCAADVDNDGRFDLFFANYGPNGLFLNRGKGRFEDVSKSRGIAIDGRYDTCAFGDLDNDGRVDLYVNGTFTGGKQFPDYLFRHAGTRYEDVTPDNIRAINADHGAAWVDVDGDGRVDLSLTGVRPDGMHSVLRNTGTASGNRALRLHVVDDRGRSLPGAVVRVFAAGTARRLMATALVDTGSGYDAQHDVALHVGVGAAPRVDIDATFPAAGRAMTGMLRDVRVADRQDVLHVVVRSPR
jgi:hypothetical protein